MSGFLLTGDMARLARMVATVGALASSDFRKAVSRAAAEETLDYAMGRFEAQKGPDGQAWKKREVFRDKEGNEYHSRKDPDGQILRDRGRLQRSLSVVEVKESSFRMGTRVVYAAIHQSGGVIRAKGRALAIPLQAALFGGAVAEHTVMVQKVQMPARPYMPVGDSPPELDEAIDEAVAALMRRRGLL